jgi:hypothetical protein
VGGVGGVGRNAIKKYRLGVFFLLLPTELCLSRASFVSATACFFFFNSRPPSSGPKQGEHDLLAIASVMSSAAVLPVFSKKQVLRSTT